MLTLAFGDVEASQLLEQAVWLGLGFMLWVRPNAPFVSQALKSLQSQALFL